MTMKIPQTGRQPLAWSQHQIREALRKRHPQDQVDYFATDPNPDIRQLGRLALRRSDINDLFTLGDLCIQRSLTDDNRLLVFYVGKALIAFRRAATVALNDIDRMMAYRAISDVNRWLVSVAEEFPARRNLAVALWALADENPVVMDEAVIEGLLKLYTESGEQVDAATGAARSNSYSDGTMADQDVELHLSQTAAT